MADPARPLVSKRETVVTEQLREDRVAVVAGLGGTALAGFVWPRDLAWALGARAAAACFQARANQNSTLRMQRDDPKPVQASTSWAEGSCTTKGAL